MYSPDYSEDDVLEGVEKLHNQINPAAFLAELEVIQTDSEMIEQHVGPLDYHQHQLFQNILEDFADICAKSQTEISRTTEIKHCIHLEKDMPIAQKPYRLNPENAQFLKDELHRMESSGIIQRSYSPWASPVVLVNKPDGGIRFCVTTKN